MPRNEEFLVLSPGEIFDRRYRVIRELGRGGFAAVYLAEHLEIGHRVAIKLLHGNRSDARFVREGKVLSKLRSPYTVRMLDFGRTDGDLPFIVCDYVDGVPLDEVVRSRGPMAPDRALVLLSQVLESLAEAHELGIVHRDLKPANLFLTDSGDVRVLDFGVAKLLPAALIGNAALTNPGFTVGTPAYMAPEQLAGAPIVAATDLFSLGLVVWELLFGRRANDSRDNLRAAARQFGRRYVFDQAPLSREIVELLNAFVAQNVELRPTDGADALQQLKTRWRRNDHGREQSQPPPVAKNCARDDSATTAVETPQAGVNPVFCSWPTGFCWAMGARVFWAGDDVQPVEIRLPDGVEVSALSAWGVGRGCVGTADGHVAYVGEGAFDRLDVGARVTAVAQDGASMIAGTTEGTVLRFCAGQRSRIAAVPGPVRALACSKAQTTIAIGAGRTVFLRDTVSGGLRSIREFDEDIVSIVCSPDDYLLAILTASELIVASAVTLDSVIRFRNNRGKIVAVRFTDDGQLQTAVLQGEQLQIAAVE